MAAVFEKGRKPPVSTSLLKSMPKLTKQQNETTPNKPAEKRKKTHVDKRLLSPIMGVVAGHCSRARLPQSRPLNNPCKVVLQNAWCWVFSIWPSGGTQQTSAWTIYLQSVSWWLLNEEIFDWPHGHAQGLIRAKLNKIQFLDTDSPSPVHQPIKTDLQGDANAPPTEGETVSSHNILAIQRIEEDHDEVLMADVAIGQSPFILQPHVNEDQRLLVWWNLNVFVIIFNWPSLPVIWTFSMVPEASTSNAYLQRYARFWR